MPAKNPSPSGSQANKDDISSGGIGGNYKKLWDVGVMFCFAISLILIPSHASPAWMCTKKQNWL